MRPRGFWDIINDKHIDGLVSVNDVTSEKSGIFSVVPMGPLTCVTF